MTSIKCRINCRPEYHEKKCPWPSCDNKKLKAIEYICFAKNADLKVEAGEKNDISVEGRKLFNRDSPEIEKEMELFKEKLKRLCEEGERKREPKNPIIESELVCLRCKRKIEYEIYLQKEKKL